MREHAHKRMSGSNNSDFDHTDDGSPRWNRNAERLRRHEYQDAEGRHVAYFDVGRNPGETEKVCRWTRLNTLSFGDRIEPEDKVAEYFGLDDDAKARLDLYRVKELKQADPAALVFICEGEKDVDRLIGLGLVATTNPNGSGKWDKPKFAEHVRGRDVVILEDNDESGRAHAQKVLAAVRGVVSSVRILRLPGLKAKGDVSDWLDSGRTCADLISEAANAAFVTDAPSTPSLLLAEERRAAVERLASLSPGDYETERKRAAKELNWRASVLDMYVQYARPPQAEKPVGQGTSLEFPPIEPWPDRVDGMRLVEELQTSIIRHVVLNEHQALAVALWILHAHALDAADHSPRLHISSPVKRCGKTVLLSVIARLVPRPLPTENISTAALFRLMEMHRPTLLIDEVDTFLKDKEDMRGMLNAGHRRDGQVIRLVGDDHDPRGFRVWGAIVLAGIGDIPDTIEDRSITISLRRRRANEAVVRLGRNNAHLDILAQKAARWTADNIASFSENVDLPEELNDRAQDNWRPLIAIADAISREFGVRARQSALVLELEKANDDDEGAGTTLLADVFAIFEASGSAQLSSEYIVAELNKMDDRPWPTWRRGQPLTKNSLARLLKPFGIKSKQIKSTNTKGYERIPVVEAHGRYCAVRTEEEIVLVEPALIDPI